MIDDNKSQNFIERQAGKTVSKGSIIKLNNNKFKTKEPSIPSKYSTMFIEKDILKGFGSSSNRFNEILSENEHIPGPGSYSIYQDSIITNDSIVFSKKGFGNFASNNKKLSNSIYLNTGPGPGYYKVKKQNKKENIPKKNNIMLAKNFLENSRNLEKIKKDREIVKKNRGPGYYNLNNNNNNNIKNSAFVFKNSNRKEIKINCYNNKIYDNSKNFIIKNKFNKKGNLLGMFKKTSYKKPVKDQIKSDLEKMNKLIDEKNLDNKQKVGPGTYNLEGAYKSLNQKFYNKKGLNNFQTGYQDRFGNLYPPFNLDLFITPGPGNYNINTDEINNKVIKRPFLDKIDKNDLMLAKENIPSEYIYNTDPLPKKISFHLNINNGWV